MPASRIHDVVHGKRPVDAEPALRLARFFGTDAQSWVNPQAHYDLEREDQAGGAGEEGDKAARGETGRL